MPRPARPWFRFYVEAMRDPKLGRLTPAQRWVWVAILAAARESRESGLLLIAEGVPMASEDLARYADTPHRDVKAALQRMFQMGMVEFDDETGVLSVPSFKGRQYESDNSAERTAKWRHNSVTVTPVVTPPESETDTESENLSSLPTPPPAAPTVDDDELKQEAHRRTMVVARAGRLQGTFAAYERVVLAGLKAEGWTPEPPPPLTPQEALPDVATLRQRNAVSDAEVAPVPESISPRRKGRC